jgi:hypothetical protein
MAFAILRTAKLKTAGNCGGLNNHLERKMEVPNADQELTYLNSRQVGSGDLVKDVASRLQAAGIEKPRKNAVMAIEHLMTASPEAFRFSKSKDTQTGKPTLAGSKEDIQRWNGFVKGCRQWLHTQYDAHNLVNFTVHLDEQTPHIHAIVVPIDAKGKLNCRAYLGGREKLRAMQSSFADVHQGNGLQRGIEGSQARHTTVKQFYAHANAFEQAPSLSFAVDAPMASIQAPETNFLGQMKESPTEYVEREQQRLKAQWEAQQQETLLRAQQKATALHQAAKAGEVLKLENARLQGQLKGLQQLVETLNKQRELAKGLLELIVGGKVRPEELRQAIEQVPGKEDQRQASIQNLLKGSGIAVKEPEPEKKPEVKRHRGMRM